MTNLTNLRILDFDNNQVSDIVPLVENGGLGEGDKIYMSSNNLNLTENSKNMQDIQTLRDRGVRVNYYPMAFKLRIGRQRPRIDDEFDNIRHKQGLLLIDYEIDNFEK